MIVNTFIQTDLGNLYPKEGTVVPITKSIAEIKDLSKRKGGFTKTITLVGDKTTNRILNSYYDVNVFDGTFNHKRKVKVTVVQDSLPVLIGYMRLFAVNRISKSSSVVAQEVEYQISVTDETSSLFQDIGEGKLSDIDISWMKHVYSAQSIIDSQSHTVADGYKYPYPMVADNMLYRLEDFKPAIYAKVLWDKIFTDAGYSYQWDELADPEFRFDKLLMPYTGNSIKATKEDSINAGAKVGSSTLTMTKDYAQNEAVSSIDTQTFIPDDIIRDLGNNYDTPTNKYVLPMNQDTGQFTTHYKIKFRYFVRNLNYFKVRLKCPVATPPQAAPAGLRFRPFVTTFIGPGQHPLYTNTNLLAYSSDQWPLPGPLTLFYDGDLSQMKQFVPGDTTLFATDGPTQNGIFELNADLPVNGYPLTAGTQIAIALGSFISQNNTSAPVKFYDLADNPVSSCALGIEFIDVEITHKPKTDKLSFGMLLDPSRCIPEGLSKKDFVKGILNHFNLYAESDENQENNIIIKSRNDYYDSGKEYDWTKKLVTNLPTQIKFAVEETGKRKILTYTEGKDLVNVGYQDNVGSTYGQQGYIFSDEYAQGTTFQTVPWEPTPILKNKYDQFVLSINGLEPKTGPKLIYDGGVKSCAAYPILNYGNANTTTWNPNAPNLVQSSTYNYTGHWDDPINPVWDLNFGRCSYYFYNDYATATNNTMFNLHHSRTFNQIENGRIMEAYFMLDSNDMYKIKLNDRVWVHDSWWNIIEIRDYDANNRKPTKVKLITTDPNQGLNKFSNPPADIVIPGISPDKPIGGPLDPYRPSKGDVSIFKPVLELVKQINDSGNIIESRDPVTVIGTGNIVREGFTGIVLGDNNEVRSSDGPAINIDGSLVISKDGVTDIRVKIIEAGEDIVLDRNKRNIQDVIDAGENVITTYGGVNSTRQVYEGNPPEEKPSILD